MVSRLDRTADGRTLVEPSVLAVSLMVTFIVTLLLNIVLHGTALVEWETSFCFAILFGIMLSWMAR